MHDILSLMVLVVSFSQNSIFQTRGDEPAQFFAQGPAKGRPLIPKSRAKKCTFLPRAALFSFLPAQLGEGEKIGISYPVPGSKCMFFRP